MSGVLAKVPEAILEERRRLGHDLFDEMWEGVLHMVPPPSGWHQEMGTELVVVLHSLTKARGLVLSHETGLFRRGDDYRTPDLVVSTRAQRTARGVEGGAVFAAEIPSPRDETREKLPFYAAFGLQELLILNPDTRAVELLVLRGDRLDPVSPDAQGRFISTVLGVSFATVAGPKLMIAWEGGAASI